MTEGDAADRRRAALVRSFVESSQDVFIAVRRDGTIEYASPAVRSLLGYDPLAVVGENVVDWLNEDDIDRALIQLGENVGRVVGGITRFSVRTAQGGWIPVELEAAHVNDGANEFIGLFGRDGRDHAFIEAILSMLVNGAARDLALATVVNTIDWQSMHSIVAVSWADGTGYHRVTSGELDDALAGIPDEDWDGTDPWSRGRATLETQHGGVTDETGDLRDLAEAAGLDSYWVEAVDWHEERPPATITIWLTAEHSSEVHTYGMELAKILVALVLRWTEHVPPR